jgi:branched-subunit amino acid aminotransferase/4-amino-4-deoxychorismate lyase
LEALVWSDGRLVPADRPAIRPDDSAFLHGLGCYSTGRYEAGRLRFGARVAGRLVRDARALGFGALDPDACLEAMLELGRACFGRGVGVVRLQASVDARGEVHLLGTARGLGAEPAHWRGLSSPWPHEGAGPAPGVKLAGHPRHALLRELLRRRSLDEALCLDAADRLVEGTRTSLVVVGHDGRAATPPLARGGVAGVAREIVLERLDALEEADVDAAALRSAREIVALNAVRGARPLVELDGKPVGSGGPGACAARLQAALDAEA